LMRMARVRMRGVKREENRRKEEEERKRGINRMGRMGRIGGGQEGD
jgi:hypothetical protein